MNTFKTKLEDGFKINLSNTTSIPPASIHSFLKHDPQFPGIVLTGFNEQFKNKYVYYFLIA